jgi:hypothetical protein
MLVEDESVVENEFKLAGLHGLVCYLSNFKQALMFQFLLHISS